MIEGQVVAEDDHGHRCGLEDVHQRGQGGDVFPMHLDELDRDAGIAGDLRMHGFHQRRLAHATGAPQENVVGRKTFGEAQRVVEQDVTDVIHS
ncbi:hypothetical protein D9M70_554730 [compost metagenome]